MRQAVKDFFATNPRMVFCRQLYGLSGGYAREGGDYDAAQTWLAKNGYRFEIKADAWVKA